MSDPNTTPALVVSAQPVVLPAPGRGDDLQVRMSAPATGSELPVIVFSHGYGWSMNGYAPLADHWAAQGFVVVQPTHLDSRTLAIPAEAPAPRGSGATASKTSPAYWTGSTPWKQPYPASPDASTTTASPWPATPGEPRR